LANSIAILPFVNRSPDSADAYLADALPEQIVGRLARVNGLVVKSHTVVLAQWRRTPDPVATAHALRVQWFVTGSLRRAGRKLTVSAELVRAASGDGVWAAPFRREDDDLAAVEEQVAESVAVGIVGRLAPDQLSALRVQATRNTEAYRLYLYGRALLGRRTPAEINAAVRALTEAVGLDPNFAGAWGRLGMARAIQVDWGNEEGLADGLLLDRARGAWARALQLDSANAEGWTARGVWASSSGDFAQAQDAFTRAVRLDSLSAETYHLFGVLYGVDNLDLPDVAAPLFARAVTIDPDLRNSWRHLALLRAHQGRLADAEALIDTALTRGAWALGSSERSIIRFARGNAAGALRDLADWERDVSSMPPGRFGNAGPSALGLGVAQWRSLFAIAAGDSAGALDVLVSLAARDQRRALGADRRLAVVYALLGRRDSAMSAVERIRAAPPADGPRCGPSPCSMDLELWRFLHEPLLASLRDDPRFVRLLEETRPHVPWVEGQR
jgi:TolB-like protein/Tfp pilus assembly protein PilF